jgi:hypothetical protein
LTHNKLTNFKIMKTIYLLAIVFAIVFQSNNGFSQKLGFLKVQFDVIDSVKKLIDNPTITVFEGSKEFYKLNTNPCSLQLDNNKTYSVEVSALNYGKKTILFDTKVPKMELIYKYKFSVGLFHQTSFEKPATKIGYDEKENKFDFSLK